MTVQEMEIELIKLENDVIELENEKREYIDGQQKINYIMGTSPRIDSVSTNLIGDINGAFQCGNVTSMIAPSLADIGAGYNKRIDSMTSVAEQKNKDCDYKIEQKRQEIEDLKYRIDLQKSFELKY